MRLQLRIILCLAAGLTACKTAQSGNNGDSGALKSSVASGPTDKRARAVRHRKKHDALIREEWQAMTHYAMGGGLGLAEDGAEPSPEWLAAPHNCKRNPEGGTLVDEPHLYSKDGVLKVTLSYQTAHGDDGNTRFCYVTPDGKQSPVLHVKPGDHLKLSLKNDTPTSQHPAEMAMAMAPSGSPACGSAMMMDATTNLHYHGTNTRPVCHQDEVLKTMVNPGETFEYDLEIPADEPPGLYWYHPHVHGLAEAAVQGGASGALIVDGIHNINPELAGIAERVFVLRDQLLPTSVEQSDATPAWDISVNNMPILYPNFKAPELTMRLGRPELWRVVNTAGDAMFDVELRYDGVPQPLKVYALDGVATNSQNGKRRGAPLTLTHYILAPGSRIEFVVTPPTIAVKKAQLVTRPVDTGPGGDLDPERPLFTVKLGPANEMPAHSLAAKAEAPNPQRFAGLAEAKPSATRKLFFTSTDVDDDTDFFLALDGTEPKKFDAAAPPSITTTQGATEDWVIENHTDELHSFHIHQLHFLVLERDGVPVPAAEQQFLDVVNVPYWKGDGPYPSVKLRMDFRGPYVGDFVYHCHILEHEDKGMMQIIRVEPKSGS